MAVETFEFPPELRYGAGVELGYGPGDSITAAVHHHYSKMLLLPPLLSAACWLSVLGSKA